MTQNVVLIFNRDADDRIEGGRFDCECFALVSEAERSGLVVAEAGPQIIDRMRKAANGGRHGDLRVWVTLDGRTVDASTPSAEVLLVMKGCLVDETQVPHDWFGKTMEAAR